MGILNKLKYFLSLNAKVLIYNSLILSHLNFCILAWGYKCDRIIKLQKKIVRILSLSKYNAHTDPLFKTHKFQEFKFHFKFIIINYHIIYKIYLLIKNTIHSHATRTEHNIHKMRPNHEYARKCIRYDIPILINNAPIEILETVYTHCLHGFAGYIKLKILESYQERCTIIKCYICSRN